GWSCRRWSSTPAGRGPMRPAAGRRRGRAGGWRGGACAWTPRCPRAPGCTPGLGSSICPREPWGGARRLVLRLARQLVLARLQAAAVAVGAERAEVQDGLAVADLVVVLEPDAGLVLARPAVDDAAAVERIDVVLARAALHFGVAVAGIDPVVAGATL